jgi:hypothetical protein
MNAQKYNSAIRLTTMAALKGGLGIAEAIGVLELAKGNLVQMGISKQAQPPSEIIRVEPPIPPGLEKEQA